MNLKGTLPTLILNELKQGTIHGYQIAQDIKTKSKGVLDFREGTLYPTLHQLEHKGLIKSYEQAENGRKRRYYQLTENGTKTLLTEREDWRRFSKAVNLILKEA